MQQARVVVQLLDNEKILEINNNGDSDEMLELLNAPQEPHSGAEDAPSQRETEGAPQRLHPIDFKTLEVYMHDNNDGSYTSQRMVFDYVSYASECSLQTEMWSMLDELLLMRRNCCLVRFNPRRNCYVRFLYKLLVSDVSKRLQQLHASIHYIKVSYFDIGPKSVHDMLANNTIGPAKRARQCNAKNKFANTEELGQWLLNEFRTKCETALGHDELEFQLCIKGTKQNLFHLRMSIFTVHFYKMVDGDIQKWVNYMDHLGKGAGNRKFFAHTALTVRLRSHLEKDLINNVRMLFLFNVPTQSQYTSCARDLLQMGYAVVANRKLLNVMLCRQRNATGANTPKVNSAAGTSISMYDLNATPTQTRSGGVSFTIPMELESVVGHSKQKLLSADLHQLCVWYKKIDEKHTSARKAMELYFNHLYQQQCHRLCGSVRQMTSSCDVGGNQADSEEDNAVDVTHNFDHSQTQDYRAKYYNALETFKQLKTDITLSSYADILSAYFQARDFEFFQHMVRFKIAQLKHLQERIADIIAEDLSLLYRDVKSSI